jgi:hypothetical protein
MIDEKQKLETEIHDLKLSKKDLKNDLDIRIKRV